jgi:K+-sensing histidine kinase KdpD
VNEAILIVVVGGVILIALIALIAGVYIAFKNASSVGASLVPQSVALYLIMIAVLAVTGISMSAVDTFGLFQVAGCISAAILLTGAMIIEGLTAYMPEQESEEERRRQYTEDLETALNNIRRRKKE